MPINKNNGMRAEMIGCTDPHHTNLLWEIGDISFGDNGGSFFAAFDTLENVSCKIEVQKITAKNNYLYIESDDCIFEFALALLGEKEMKQ